MAEQQGEQTEALLIRGPEGAVYAVPRALLDQCRLPDEAAAPWREDAEVQGHIIIVGGYQALGFASLWLPSSYRVDRAAPQL